MEAAGVPRSPTADAAGEQRPALGAAIAGAYLDCFDAFVADTYAAIAGEEPEGLPRFADGLRAARVTDAVLGSAASGGWVDV